MLEPIAEWAVDGAAKRPNLNAAINPMRRLCVQVTSTAGCWSAWWHMHSRRQRVPRTAETCWLAGATDEAARVSRFPALLCFNVHAASPVRKGVRHGRPDVRSRKFSVSFYEKGSSRGAIPSPRKIPRRFVNGALRPQVRNWPRIQDFCLSPLAPESGLDRRVCAPASFTGGCFSASPVARPDLVNSSAYPTDPKRDDSKRMGSSWQPAEVESESQASKIVLMVCWTADLDIDAGAVATRVQNLG